MASVYALRSFCTEKLLYTEKLLHTASFLHTKSFTRSKLLQKKVFTRRSFLVYNDNRNCSSKTGWILAPNQKKREFEALFKRNFTRKITSAKIKKSTDKSLSQPWCSHSNTFYKIQLRKTIVLRMQPRHEATLTQPLQCDLQTLNCETQKSYAQRRRKLQLQNRISTPKRKKYI